MKLPLRPFAILSFGLLCTGACCTADAVNPGPPPSVSVPVHAAPDGALPPAPPDMVVIPGPLKSFLRMAGVSQEVSPDGVLPLVSRNVFLRGYDSGQQTEFLLLLNRYVEFARELQSLADANGTIHITGCDDAVRLLHVLGYQFQQPCGHKSAYLTTANAERAFLTIDSGFPLVDLEEALQKHIDFTYSWPATPVPALFREKDWTSASSWRKKGGATLLDVLLHDPNLDRLYWALSKQDEQTRLSLRRSPGLKVLLPVAPALDFYGSQISIRSGRVLLPGGQAAEHGWEDLVGASPKYPGDFVIRLCTRDRGWLAGYFDALSRVSREQQVHLTQAPRLKRLYEAYSDAGIGSSATAGVFQKNAELLMLFTRLQWQPGGDPYVPATLAIWSEILNEKSNPKAVHDWVKHSHSLNSPEQLLEAMTASANVETNIGPLQIYLMMSEIDNARAPGPRLSDATVRLLAGKFSRLHSWYLIFSEFPALDDTSITRFLNSADAVNGISSPALRANALGAFQANVGIWEILARQQELPAKKLNTSWQETVQPFATVSSNIKLFEASRASLRSVLKAATGEADLSQDEIIDLLAGPPQESAAGRRVHEELADRMRSVMDDQRLVSLDTLFGLNDGLNEMAHGSAVGDRLIPLAGNLREFEMPRPIFTASEKIEWAPEIYSSRHAELQVRTDLTRVIRGPGSPAQLEAARGQLTPFLRDTLVGLNYAYYEPPGAQVLHQNPLFVRSHDFSGASVLGFNGIWEAPDLIGIGITAGGGAYLIGSLADLPYALATMEEDFISPDNVQALIWRGAAPALLVSAIEPRWWRVSTTELHAATLYQRFGEELLRASAGNEELRSKVLDILSGRMAPRRLDLTERALQKPEDVGALIPQLLPAETFYLAAEFRRRFPAEAASLGAAGPELDALVRNHPSDASEQRLSRDFGVPHPTLEQTNACAILNVKPLPAFGGSPSRLFGESWESTNLYWARLADEMGYPPAMLNLLAPELSRHMIASIFATDIEDWPALLRAMEQTGDDFRHGKIRLPAAATLPQQATISQR